MDIIDKDALWRQFGASIDMLENAVEACPDELWVDDDGGGFWHFVSHTLFWLDYYLTADPKNFAPPEPFGLEELDPAGKLPPRPYTKQELSEYLKYGREKCRKAIDGLTAESAHRCFKFGSVDLSMAELMLYNMRHVQHHTAQLNLMLRQSIDSAPRWVAAARD